MSDYVRPVRSRYRDPVEVVWIATAVRLGLVVRRSPGVFATTDGQGTLIIGNDDLDPDDCLAQMMFHELCHWMVNGPDTVHELDWGFPLGDPPDPREHACVRLEAVLAEPFGLRAFFAPTGKFREYFDQVGDPLVPLDDSDWEREVMALLAAGRAVAATPRFAPIAEALAATAAIRAAVLPFLADYRSDEADDLLPPLWAPAE
jgi:hypothetical protein